jgi:hypothetical protein
MKLVRKIQIVTAAFVLCGALGLGALSPSLAFAATCNPKFLGCQKVCPVPQQLLQLCASVAPPGCTASGGTCIYSTAQCNIINPYAWTCYYH